MIRDNVRSNVQTKHREERDLKKVIKVISYQLRRLLPTLVYTTLLHQKNLAIHIRLKFIVKHHKHKLIKFSWQYHTQSEIGHKKVNKYITHTFSSFVLLTEEVTALSSGLLEQTLSRIKTKLYYTCEKTSKYGINIKK